MSGRLLALGIAMLTSWVINVSPLSAQSEKEPRKNEILVRVTYPIADLVVPIEDHSAFEERKPARNAKTPNRGELAEKLIQLITGTVAKDSWEPAGGRGSIQYFPLGMALVVNQTKEVQEEIMLLLTALRRVQDVQITVEVRFIEVPSKTAERLLMVMKDHGQPARDRSVAVDDKRLLSLLDMVQADRLGTIRQAPTITLYDGQTGAVNAMLDKVGARFDVSGVVSPDRRIVRLWLDFEDVITPTRSMRSAETFSVPANQTLIWPAGEVGGTHVFVMARPRVVINQEEEKLFLGKIPPIPGR